MATVKKKNAFIELVKGDIWIILLDIIAVNAAYFLGILIRFFVRGKFYTSLRELPYKYSKFAPFYTIICILIFFLFRLYGGMWRYAGISDLNRIIVASAVTALAQVVGTLIFVERMPLTFYFIGAALQFSFIVIIRFAYRIIIVERRRISKKQANAAVVGSGEECHYILRLLNNGLTYRPVCVIDRSSVGRLMDGLPVYNTLHEALAAHEVNNVFLADTTLTAKEKDEIYDLCKERNLPIRDYTNFFSFQAENDPFYGVQDVIPGSESENRFIPFSPPDISSSEVSEVAETLRSGWITTGPRTKVLERRLAAYIETGETGIDTERDPDRWKKRVVCLNSATAAEELNLRILGIREGDEVIVPAYTYTASASAVVHCGATVEFVDIQKDGDRVTHMPELDYDELEAAITSRTKAIITVDLGGIVCDYDRIFEIVKRKQDLFMPLESDGTPLGDLSSRIQKQLGRIAIVADCAHSLGASRIVNGRKTSCGAIADFSSFSFHAVKNFTTAEGGASAWRSIDGIGDDEIYKFFQLLSLHGQNKDALAKTRAGAWEYDIIGPWYKCNMTDIMAAIGLRQLDRYAELLDKRKEIIRKYDAVCDELGISHLNHHTEGMDSSNHLYLIRIPGIGVEKRNLFIEKMIEQGVSANVHYKPLPMMTAYKALGWDIRDFPNAFAYYENLVSLPLHTLLTDRDTDRVCDALRQAFEAVTA